MSTKKKLEKEAIPTRKDKVCHGDLCWNPIKEKLELKLTKCPIEISDKLKAQTPMVVREIDKEDKE